MAAANSYLRSSHGELLQTSGFSGNSLTLDQLRYIAIDGAVSLEAFEKMEEMPDVIKHLEKGDLTLDKKVR